MAECRGIVYRRAEDRDTFSMMKLYQLASRVIAPDSIFLDHLALRASIVSDNSAWIIAERGGETLAMMSMLIDADNRLAKLNRLIVDPAWEHSDELLHEALPLLIIFLKERGVEVMYTTTRSMTLAQQELTLRMGFRILGIFPNAAGGDSLLRINGLTAFFFDEALHVRRVNDFPLHPFVKPFYDIASRQCEIPPLPEAKLPPWNTRFEPLPPLEFVHAPRFVAHRFARLNEKRSLSMHFYPFSIPNALVTDPAQRIEIFVCMAPEMRFATLIAERLDAPVNPTELYDQISRMLNTRNISYIEVINDAGDAWGIECIARAGYLPTAYFPALKRQGEKRRDYVVMARSFDRLFAVKPSEVTINKTYLEYLAAYYQLEGQQYLSQIHGA